MASLGHLWAKCSVGPRWAPWPGEPPYTPLCTEPLYHTCETQSVIDGSGQSALGTTYHHTHPIDRLKDNLSTTPPTDRRQIKR